jgi:hypothetical protein
MPARVVFSGGTEVAVTAGVEELEGELRSNAMVPAERFVGFRGDDAVAGGRVLINPATVAYVEAIDAP